MLTIRGKRDGGQIIAGAHYDGSGIGDNDSGVALLLATATGLVHAEPEFTLKLVFFNREEEAKAGCRFYAGRMSDEAVASTLYDQPRRPRVRRFLQYLWRCVRRQLRRGFIVLVEGEDEPQPEPEPLEGCDFAADTAERLGFMVYCPEELDGYFDANGRGMEPEHTSMALPQATASQLSLISETTIIIAPVHRAFGVIFSQPSLPEIPWVSSPSPFGRRG